MDAQHLHVVGPEVMGQKRRDVGGARIHIHRDHRDQHQDRAEEGVEEELERRVDAFLAAPDADDQEHRDQPCLEEQVEQHQIQRAEHAQHQRFQHQEGDHVFLDAGFHLPAGGDGQRHQEGGQHHEQDRDAIDAHLVFQAEDPVVFFDELKAGIGGIEAEQHEKRHKERRRGGEQRQPFGVALRRRVIAAQEQRQDACRDRGDEGDDGEKVFHISSRPPRASSR